jgi:hypothetical protein
LSTRVNHGKFGLHFINMPLQINVKIYYEVQKQQQTKNKRKKKEKGSENVDLTARKFSRWVTS